METYAGTGLVRFDYRHFQVISAESSRAAEAAECASEQGQFWQYHDALFANQQARNMSDPALRNFAVALGLDEEEFNDCLSAGEHRQVVREDNAEARARGVESTPTLFLNGEMLPGGITFEQLQSLIASQTQ